MTNMSAPSYLGLHETGELTRRANAARELMSPCQVCPRQCGVDRLSGEMGDCRTAEHARISSVGPHFGEEAPLVGNSGSGTIFFSGCNLNCDFCQNWEISQEGSGQEIDPEGLARAFLHIQGLGCHNLNLVTPTHATPQILSALELAVARGFNLPIVYNCGGYESLETLRLLSDVVDIYMPDLKFTDSIPATRFCQADDYPEVAMAAITEMHRQVGDLTMDDQGIATRGLLVRHLVMPEGLAGSEQAAAFLSGLSPDTFVNVMAQYRPCHNADTHPELTRGILPEEHQQAIQAMRAAGLSRLDGVQERAYRIRLW
jgi:putative pyruvate formate lyase activating enzyme